MRNKDREKDICIYRERERKKKTYREKCKIAIIRTRILISERYQNLISFVHSILHELMKNGSGGGYCVPERGHGPAALRH